MKPHTIYGIENIEGAALSRFYDAMKQDYVVKGALMPDAHAGYALPIGAVVASRDIMTGEWKTKAQAKTHDGKELPYFVVKVGG